MLDVQDWVANRLLSAANFKAEIDLSNHYCNEQIIKCLFKKIATKLYLSLSWIRAILH